MLRCYTDQHNTHLFKRDRPISVRSQKKIYRKSTDKTNPHHYPTLTGITAATAKRCTMCGPDFCLMKRSQETTAES
jgi:predicted nucleic acid binding AN1-type Zn finger protein